MIPAARSLRLCYFNLPTGIICLAELCPSYKNIYFVVDGLLKGRAKLFKTKREFMNARKDIRVFDGAGQQPTQAATGEARRIGGP